MKKINDKLNFRKMEYDIDNYYVGEIKREYLLKFYRLNIIDDNSLKKLYRNGAIIINNDFIFTLFYKSKDYYFCLHDASLFGENIGKNLIPFKQFLPKVNFDIPNKITPNESLFLFRCLFDINYYSSFEKLYNNNYININDLFVGKYKYQENENCRLYKFMLNKSSAKVILEDYKDIIYNCLFYLNENRLLNLNNNCLYDDIFDSTLLGNDACALTQNFKDFLSDKKSKYEEMITLNKALTLFKRYNK